MKHAKYKNEMTMTNVLLNINAYSAQLNIHSNSFCAKKIISDHEYKFMSGDYNQSENYA